MKKRGSMRILIVGFKEDSSIIESQLKKEHQIIGYCECFYDGKNEEKNLFSIEDINEIKFDNIILAISNLELSSTVRNILILEYQINSDKIIDFYRLYEASIPMMRVDKVMRNPNHNDYEGMILGISHSELGIIPKYLEKSFCNLAVSSQDLYYNLKTLEYCISNYYEKIKNLKYAIIDMFDYTYFNYDISLSKKALGYWSWGGYNLDEHNFSRNKTFKNYSFDNVIEYLVSQRLDGISEKHVDAWEDLFINIFSYNNYKDFTNVDRSEHRLKTVSNEEIRSFNTEVSIVKNKYPETIRENIEIFDKLIKTLKNINPNINIYILLMPKYIEIENKTSLNRSEWKQYFENMIMSFKEIYKFEYYNLKDCTEISSHRMYYQDVSHLNYFGAINFTKYLNNLIF